jgi:hypothetical protein
MAFDPLLCETKHKNLDTLLELMETSIDRRFSRIWWFFTILIGVLSGIVGYSINEASAANSKALVLATQREGDVSISQHNSDKLDEILRMLKKN